MADRAAANTPPVRILGLTQQRVEIHDGRVRAKLGDVFNALAKPFDLVGVRSTRMDRLSLYYSLARNPRGARSRWISAARLSPWAFRHRTRRAQRYIEEFDGRFDLVFQVHTLFAPGLREPSVPYVVCTDNTFMMSERHWPEWVPLANRRVRDEWIELERSVYRNAEYVFPWSEFARRSMIEDYGVAPERAIATGVGANLSLDRIDPAKDYGSQTALFVGYEFERKGGRVLMRAWERVRRALPRAELIVVGPRTPPAEGVPGIRWVRRMPREELEQLYRKATLFVMPSLFEPWGHVFLEAMGFGLPCIAADTCAMPEIVQQDRTGLLVPPGDHEALADALVALLADPERSREMGRAAHAEVVRRHTWDRVIERMSPYVRRAAGRDVAVPKREPVGCVNEVNSAR